MPRLACLLVLSTVVSCVPNQGDDALEHRTLRVGVLPDQSVPALEERYSPLLDYLAGAVEVDFELVIPAGYEELLAAFDERALDLAWFGALTFVQAERDSAARPLVSRDIDLSFTTTFVASARHAGRSLEDFAGSRFAFGPRLSTSGHLMPRQFLAHQGIEPESYFAEVRHSEGHDESLHLAVSGAVDLAAVNSAVVQGMLRDGRLPAGSAVVIARTPPFTNYVWATQPDLDERLRQSLLDAFLALDGAQPSHQAVLEPMGAGGFVPVSSRDYEELRIAVRALEERSRR